MVDYESVPCPWCNAGAGEACDVRNPSRSTRATGVHAARANRAQRAAEGAKLRGPYGPRRRVEPIEMPGAGGLMAFPFPVRSGVVAKLYLPADLTTDEASRLAKYIAALADDQPAAHAQEVAGEQA